MNLVIQIELNGNIKNAVTLFDIYNAIVLFNTSRYIFQPVSVYLTGFF